MSRDNGEDQVTIHFPETTDTRSAIEKMIAAIKDNTDEKPHIEKVIEYMIAVANGSNAAHLSSLTDEKSPKQNDSGQDFYDLFTSFCSKPANLTQLRDFLSLKPYGYSTFDKKPDVNLRNQFIKNLPTSLTEEQQKNILSIILSITERRAVSQEVKKVVNQYYIPDSDYGMRSEEVEVTGLSIHNMMESSYEINYGEGKEAYHRRIQAENELQRSNINRKEFFAIWLRISGAEEFDFNKWEKRDEAKDYSDKSQIDASIGSAILDLSPMDAFEFADAAYFLQIADVPDKFGKTFLDKAFSLKNSYLRAEFLERYDYSKSSKAIFSACSVADGERRLSSLRHLFKDKNIKNLIVDFVDENGRTAMMALIAVNAPLEFIKKLAEKNPDLITKSSLDGNTPLHEAVIHGNLEMVNFLLAKNADVSIKNAEGKTALDIANATGRGEIVGLIIKTYRNKLDKILSNFKENPESLRLLNEWLKDAVSYKEVPAFKALAIHYAETIEQSLKSIDSSSRQAVESKSFEADNSQFEIEQARSMVKSFITELSTEDQVKVDRVMGMIKSDQYSLTQKLSETNDLILSLRRSENRPKMEDTVENEQSRTAAANKAVYIRQLTTELDKIVPPYCPTYYSINTIVAIIQNESYSLLTTSQNEISTDLSIKFVSENEKLKFNKKLNEVATEFTQQNQGALFLNNRHTKDKIAQIVYYFISGIVGINLIDELNNIAVRNPLLEIEVEQAAKTNDFQKISQLALEDKKEWVSEQSAPEMLNTNAETVAHQLAERLAAHIASVQNLKENIAKSSKPDLKNKLTSDLKIINLRIDSFSKALQIIVKNSPEILNSKDNEGKVLLHKLLNIKGKKHAVGSLVEYFAKNGFIENVKLDVSTIIAQPSVEEKKTKETEPPIKTALGYAIRSENNAALKALLTTKKQKINEEYIDAAILWFNGADEESKKAFHSIISDRIKEEMGKEDLRKKDPEALAKLEKDPLALVNSERAVRKFKTFQHQLKANQQGDRISEKKEELKPMKQMKQEAIAEFKLDKNYKQLFDFVDKSSPIRNPENCKKLFKSIIGNSDFDNFFKDAAKFMTGEAKPVLSDGGNKILGGKILELQTEAASCKNPKEAETLNVKLDVLLDLFKEARANCAIYIAQKDKNWSDKNPEYQKRINYIKNDIDGPLKKIQESLKSRFNEQKDPSKISNNTPSPNPEDPEQARLKKVTSTQHTTV